MKKFGFGPLFVIMILLYAMLALTSYTTSASEISHDATTNKIINATVQKQNYILGLQREVVIHRRARPNSSSAPSINMHPFFIFAFVISLLIAS